MQDILNWLLANYIELAGSLLGILYVILAARQSIWCWPVGIVNVTLYIIVFYSADLFGDMALQAFYLIMSFYGWYKWVKGSEESAEAELKISNIPKKLFIYALVATVAMSLLFGYILTFTPSDIPYWDGATTALGLTGTWMTARKYIENWAVWIFTDTLCVGIYIYKELYLTVGFYFVMTIMAIIAYRQWSKDFKRQEEAV
ncbi:MAG: nicotinamide riboside transporter PnuC [Bacteroidales bacterium]|nr:nicotinamide riboside transporter PnuC [Bacteroidales bacterium]